jgi:sigma-B regulation protein RsbU (phosphoserine phosphatase)
MTVGPLNEEETIGGLARDLLGATEAPIPQILIADDQADVLEALRLLLKGEGYHIETVSSPAAILEALKSREFDLLLMDLNYARDTTSGREGLDLLSRLKAIEGAPPIVVMTGWGTVGLAVETMRHGVGDFVEKPWDNTRLLEILRTQIEQGRVRRQIERQQAEEKVHSSQIASQFHQQEREIEEARQIQQGLLPTEIPQIAGYQIASAWQPARMVGGDYFDVLKFSENSLALCIADVAGKGMPAALLMSNLQATVRGLASEALRPEELCTRANQFICRNIAQDKFITLFYGRLDARSRRFEYTNAGHNAPIVLRRDGSHCRLHTGGGVLGVFEQHTYEQGGVELFAGDRLVLFTDGLTEAGNPDGEEFGEERLLRLLTENRARPADELQRKIMDAVSEFGGEDFQDDATLIVLAVE